MFDLESTINAIVNGANASTSFAELVDGLQTEPVNTLFSQLGIHIGNTLTNLQALNTAELDPAISVISSVSALGQAILNENILPDIVPGSTDSSVLAGTFNNLNTLIGNLTGLGISTVTIPSISEFQALSYLGGLTYNPAFTPIGTINTTTGTSANDALVNGRNGRFTIAGGGNDDLLSNLGLGRAQILGEEGNDIITNVSRLPGILDGGAGEDWLLNVGTHGNNLFGGDDNDTLINIGSGRNLLKGDNGNDTLINYGETNNRLVGGKGNDFLIHFGGDAKLLGGGGSDTLIGSDGDDLLNGGSRADLLVGGAGSDTFLIGLKVDTAGAMLDVRISGADTVADFDASEQDVIQLTISGTGASQVSGSTLSFESTTGILSLQGTALATLTGVTSFDTNTVQIMV